MAIDFPGVVPEDEALLETWIYSVSDEITSGNIDAAKTQFPVTVNIAIAQGGLHLFDYAAFLGAVVGQDPAVPGPVEIRRLGVGLYQFFHRYARTDPSFDLSTLYPTDNTRAFGT